MEVLFITRKFPPSVGGLEKLSYELYSSISKKINVQLLSWGRSQVFLPLFLPYAFLKSVFLVAVKKPDAVLLGDALLSPLGALLKFIFGVRVVVIIAGLDITYKNRFYQMLVIPSLRYLDKIVPISRGTSEIAIKKGVQGKKISVIPIGIKKNEYLLNYSQLAVRKKIEKIFKLNLDRKFVLLTVGRLVTRKGHEWFIKEVMANLDDSIIYLISGTGPRFDNISRLINTLKLGSRVKMLGKVSEETKKYLLNSADLFVMPNIDMPGDVEGFGIVCIEASSAGLPVLAADLQGIRDAVFQQKNGYLLTPEKRGGFIEKIKFLQSHKRQLSKISTSSREFSLNFDWGKIADSYIHSLKSFDSNFQ